jgi:hypothetical protein
MAEAKNQHYVPQFYLRNFSPDGARIHVYDKVTGKHFFTNIRNVAGENYFYDVPELDAMLGVEQFIEKFFHPAEKSAGKAISAILESLKKNRFKKLHPNLRSTLSTFLALQYLRTKETRTVLIELFEKLHTEMFRASLENTDTELKDVDFEAKLKKEVENQFHATTILDPEMFITISTILKGHLWIILKNAMGKVLYTSDNPVVRHGNIKHPVLSFSGLASKGIEIAFPLSPEYLLLLAESEVFATVKNKNGKVLMMTDKENVTFYNSLQLLQSYRYIFAPEPDFDLADSMCNDNPNLRNVNKSRVKVVQPGGKIRDSTED